MDTDGHQPEPDEEGEEECPEEGRDASVDARRSEVHRAIVFAAATGRAFAPDQRNSPSRFRFRPPLPLTFRLRVQPSDSASTYLRSVLGARENLRDLAAAFKG